MFLGRTVKAERSFSCAKEDKPIEIFNPLFLVDMPQAQNSVSIKSLLPSAQERGQCSVHSIFPPSIPESSSQGAQDNPDQSIFLGPRSEQLLPIGDHYRAERYLVSLWFLVLPVVVLSSGIPFPSFSTRYLTIYASFTVLNYMYTVLIDL